MSTDLNSPKWGRLTKTFVGVFAVTLILIAVWRFQGLVTTLIVAGTIAYILNPIIVWLDRRTLLSRGVAIALVYPLFALLVVALVIGAGFTLYNQAFALIIVVQDILFIEPQVVQTWLNHPVEIGAWRFELSELNLDIEQLSQQLFTWLQFFIGQSALLIRLAASTTLSWIGWLILIFVLSIYFAVDLPRFSYHISQAIHQPGYRRDVERLMEENGRIWQAYLRGRLALALIIGLIFTLIFYFFGVQYALTLGVLAFFLDFFPYIGPTLVVAISTTVAVFQGDNWLGLHPLWFGLIIFIIGVLIQQIEGNWLLPRVVGEALGLHPLLVIVGVIMGGTLAGILGVLLAAPLLATGKLLAIYAWRKMFDLEPFTEPFEGPQPEEEVVNQQNKRGVEREEGTASPQTKIL